MPLRGQPFFVTEMRLGGSLGSLSDCLSCCCLPRWPGHICATTETASDPEPGIARAVSFDDFKGTRMKAGSRRS
jgi:hypothetical protein